MKNLFTVCLIFVIFVVGVENTMLMFQIEKGKDVKMDFGEGMFLIKRITKASPKPQYYFSHPKQDGTWTTDGKDKIPSSAHLHWNGTMIFKKTEENDAGSYSLPLEPPQLPMPQSLIRLDLFWKTPEIRDGK
uniref:Uncharacterized protein n=1 Tax=Panagrolaimus sp. ES5 TaxID=591445 RepID=A0AC34GZ34_9BILA